MKKQLLSTLAVGVSLGIGVVANTMVADASEIESAETNEAEMGIAEEKAESTTDSEAVAALKSKVDEIKNADEQAKLAVADYEETAEMVNELVPQDAKEISDYQKDAEEYKEDVESLVSDLTNQENLNRAEEKMSDMEQISETANNKYEEATEKVSVVQKAYDNADEKVEASKEIIDKTKEEYGLNDGDELMGDAKKAIEEADAAVAEAEAELAAADIVDAYNENLENISTAEQDVINAKDKDDVANAELEQINNIIEQEKDKQIKLAKTQLENANAAKDDVDKELEETLAAYEAAKEANTEDLDRDILAYQDYLDQILNAKDDLRHMKRDLDALEESTAAAKEKWDKAVSEYGEDSDEASLAEQEYQKIYDDYVSDNDKYMQYEWDVHIMERELSGYEESYNRAVRYKELQESGEGIVSDLRIKQEECSYNVTYAEDIYNKVSNMEDDYYKVAQQEVSDAYLEKDAADSELEITTQEYNEALQSDPEKLDEDIYDYESHLAEYNDALDELRYMRRDLDALEEQKQSAKLVLDEAIEKYGEKSAEAEKANRDYQDALENYMMKEYECNEYEYSIRYMGRDLSAYEDNYNRAIKYKSLRESGEETIASLKRKQGRGERRAAAAEENLRNLSVYKKTSSSAEDNAKKARDTYENAVAVRDGYRDSLKDKEIEYVAAKDLLEKSDLEIDWNNQNARIHVQAAQKVDKAKDSREEVQSLLSEIKQSTACEDLKTSSLDTLNNEVGKAKDSLEKIDSLIKEANASISIAKKVRSMDPSASSFNVADYSEEEKEAFLEWKVRAWKNRLSKEERDYVLDYYKNNEEQVKEQIIEALDAWGISWDYAVALVFAIFTE